MIKVGPPIGRVSIPPNIILTSRVLLGALRKLPSAAIERALDELIIELDCRSGDPDYEAEPEEEFNGTRCRDRMDRSVVRHVTPHSDATLSA